MSKKMSINSLDRIIEANKKTFDELSSLCLIKRGLEDANKTLKELRVLLAKL